MQLSLKCCLSCDCQTAHCRFSKADLHIGVVVKPQQLLQKLFGFPECQHTGNWTGLVPTYPQDGAAAHVQCKIEKFTMEQTCNIKSDNFNLTCILHFGLPRFVLSTQHLQRVFVRKKWTWCGIALLFYQRLQDPEDHPVLSFLRKFFQCHTAQEAK